MPLVRCVFGTLPTHFSFSVRDCPASCFCCQVCLDRLLFPLTPCSVLHQANTLHVGLFVRAPTIILGGQIGLDIFYQFHLLPLIQIFEDCFYPYVASSLAEQGVSPFTSVMPVPSNLRSAMRFRGTVFSVQDTSRKGSPFSPGLMVVPAINSFCRCDDSVRFDYSVGLFV